MSRHSSIGLLPYTNVKMSKRLPCAVRGPVLTSRGAATGHVGRKHLPPSRSWALFGCRHTLDSLMRSVGNLTARCPYRSTSLTRRKWHRHLSPLFLLISSSTAATMRSSLNVAVIGSGISGAVCASILARGGVAVTLFESGRGAGGRMSQRREMAEDGKELLFDHGAPYFTVGSSEVMGVVGSWEERGLVTEWKEKIGAFDRSTSRFLDVGKEDVTKKYVGIPGMNAICKALCLEPGVQAKFGVTVAKMDWLQERSLWSLTDLDGKVLGQFDGVVATDKNILSPRFTGVTGSPLPLDMALSPEVTMRLQDIPVRACFALMLAFSEPLSSMPVKGFSIKNSEVLSWAFCDSSKPDRNRVPINSECWVLHSTAEYAASVIARTGLKKPSNDTLAKVAEELFQEFVASGLNIPRPFFLKAHRWGSAFPAVAIGGEDKCLWDEKKRLAICGDFCVSPNVEGAVLSGMRAGSKFLRDSSCL